MSATLQQVADLLTGAGAETLRKRTLAACLISANTILAESDQIPNHPARLAWAKATVASFAALTQAADKMFVGVCTNPTVQTAGAEATDGDINYTVAALLDSVYAAGTADEP
jgi:hypothetical protein